VAYGIFFIINRVDFHMHPDWLMDKVFERSDWLENGVLSDIIGQ